MSVFYKTHFLAVPAAGLPGISALVSSTESGLFYFNVFAAIDGTYHCPGGSQTWLLFELLLPGV